jgi:hypothetical protein
MADEKNRGCLDLKGFITRERPEDAGGRQVTFGTRKQYSENGSRSKEFPAILRLEPSNRQFLKEKPC